MFRPTTDPLRRICLQRLGATGLATLLPLPGHAQTAQRSPLMLATLYRPRFDLADAWVSEKYDGVRAYWDGRSLRTRAGNAMAAPAWFTAGWPATPLDGELWAGRGRFADTVSTVRQQTPDDAAWRTLRYMVFDLPRHGGRFEERVAALQRQVEALDQSWVQAVPQQLATTPQALQQRLTDIVAAGGEGLVLHRGSARYVPGRSPLLVKYKPFEDAEARVLAHVPGHGQYTGKTGALWVEVGGDEGAWAGHKPVRFKLGSGLSVQDRSAPPAIGSRVTFRYRGLTAQGVPRFASFVRVAPDATW